MTEPLRFTGITVGSSVALYSNNSPIGYWCLYSADAPSTRFAMYQKPTDEQIANTEKLLGWKWKEA